MSNSRPGDVEHDLSVDTAVVREKEQINLAYFDSLYIHEKMLVDSARLNAYKNAIDRLIKPGDSVLDLGAGTGILSFFAAKAGAKRVYAVDHSNVIRVAEALSANHGFDHIEFIQCHSRDLTLPEKVDVIVQEQMGSFIDEEHMIDSLVDARKRLLKPDGRILPNIIEIYAEPVQLIDSYRIPFIWEIERDGIDFSCMKARAPGNDPSYFYRTIRPHMVKTILTEPQPILTIDLESVNQDDLPSELTYSRVIQQSGRIDGICYFFRAVFDSETSLSTNPLQKDFPHNWYLKMFRLEALNVVKGEDLSLRLVIGDIRFFTTWIWHSLG